MQHLSALTTVYWTTWRKSINNTVAAGVYTVEFDLAALLYWAHSTREGCKMFTNTSRHLGCVVTFAGVGIVTMSPVLI